MKKIISSVTAISLAVVLSGCAMGNSATPTKNTGSLDVKKVCDVKSNGIEDVLALAKKYNPVAVKKGLEFKRLGMKNSQYITAIDNALKTGAKEITLLNKKGKPTKNKMSVADATERSCKFAISALNQNVEAQDTYHYAIPGDKFKY